MRCEGSKNNLRVISDVLFLLPVGGNFFFDRVVELSSINTMLNMCGKMRKVKTLSAPNAGITFNRSADGHEPQEISQSESDVGRRRTFALPVRIAIRT